MSSGRDLTERTNSAFCRDWRSREGTLHTQQLSYGLRSGCSSESLIIWSRSANKQTNQNCIPLSPGNMGGL